MLLPNFTDYYAILNITFGASADEIKKAYRAMALQYHPDRHPEDQPAEYKDKFQEITAAYEILSQPIKKGEYDLLYRQMVLGELPRYEYVEDTTPPDTRAYNHVYTKRSRRKIPFYAFFILLILVFQLLKMITGFAPLHDKNEEISRKYPREVNWNFRDNERYSR